MNEFETAVLEELRAIRQLLERQAVTTPALPVQVDQPPDALTVLRLKQAARDMLADMDKEIERKRHLPPKPKRAKKSKQQGVTSE
jgi:hypothetical protein